MDLKNISTEVEYPTISNVRNGKSDCKNEIDSLLTKPSRQSYVADIAYQSEAVAPSYIVNLHKPNQTLSTDLGLSFLIL